ncbi:unnamed protein product [Macrosiphum euphorbiae]|uniref:Uncharacterized protein n=1 Tax=Macrosiphum euphorbiae TaxID=13131 RepID=A0AAV0WJI6_9HEMI|nr:unnamed protein product [Macrosiphum euphorbiae]
MEVKVVHTRSQQQSAGSIINLRLFHEYISDSECQNYRNARVKEVTGNLFAVSEEFYSLHCVSADLKLNRGIALEFQTLTEFKTSTSKENRSSILSIGIIINLEAKDTFSQEPTLEDMYISLRNIRHFFQKFEIQNLAMCKIRCGLKQLD